MFKKKTAPSEKAPINTESIESTENTDKPTPNTSLDTSLEVTFQATPNPASLKFLLKTSHSQPFVLVPENRQFNSAIEAQISPLASKIFGFPWVHSILLGKDFIAINKEDWVEWDVLAQPLADLIAEHIKRGEAILLSETEIEEQMSLHSSSSRSTDNTDNTDRTEKENIQEVDPETLTPKARKIKDFIDEKVRPAVAMDGGDVIFHKYEKNIVYIYMQGACVGCPSSTMTLKTGIESHLQQLFPEIKEVIAVNN